MTPALRSCRIYFLTMRSLIPNFNLIVCEVEWLLSKNSESRVQSKHSGVGE